MAEQQTCATCGKPLVQREDKTFTCPQCTKNYQRPRPASDQRQQHRIDPRQQGPI